MPWYISLSTTHTITGAHMALICDGDYGFEQEDYYDYDPKSGERTAGERHMKMDPSWLKSRTCS